MEHLVELQTLIRRHARAWRSETAIPRLSLLRADSPTQPGEVVYDPRFCIVAHGRKRAVLGNRVFEYSAGSFLVVTVDLPVSAEVVEASAQEPFLAASLRLDSALLAGLLLDMPPPSRAANPPPGLSVQPVPPDLLDPMLRLVRLLDRPDDIAMLAPLAERELLYRLLQSEQGAVLRPIACAGSRLSQISRAIDWIRRHFDQPFRIETVAEVACMSPASLHRHFKAVTTMSPLQFQKRLRLQEARRRLLADAADAMRAGFAVGYESPSQFSREYRRLFGAPPAQDAARLRRASRETEAVAE